MISKGKKHSLKDQRKKKVTRVEENNSRYDEIDMHFPLKSAHEQTGGPLETFSTLRCNSCKIM